MKKQRLPVAGAPAGGRPRARYEISDERPRVAEEPAAWGRGTAQVVSATEAARNFSEIINRVCYKGETYIVEKGGKPMCELTPVEVRGCTGAELLALLAKLARPDEEFLDAVEESTRRQAPVEASPWAR